MAEFVQKELSGSMFKNQKKLTEQHPNMTGSAMIAGVEYWVSAWTKTDKNGNKWQSLSFTRKDQPKTREQAEKAVADIDDDLPF
jgi:hypothetical protein